MPTKRPARVIRRRTEPTVIKHEPLKPGMHVAPFRHPWGGLSMLAIDYEGRLAGMLAVMSGYTSYEVRLHTRPSREHGRTVDLEYDDAELFSDPKAIELYAGRGMAWEPGVHVAPWKARAIAEGIVLVIVAPDGVLWNRQETATLTPAVLADAFDEFQVACDDSSRQLYDYGEHEAVERGEHGRLLRVEAQYKRDRAEYGKLIGMGAAVEDPGITGQAD